MITKLRAAVKPHWCMGCAETAIGPGDLYLEHTGFPGEEAVEGVKHPIRGRECRECAVRYGRGDLFPGAVSGAVATGGGAEGLLRPAEVR